MGAGKKTTKKKAPRKKAAKKTGRRPGAGTRVGRMMRGEAVPRGK